MGTEDKDMLAHYQPVHLRPPTSVEGIEVDDCNVAFLTKDPMFNFSLAQALKNLNDLGTLAERSSASTSSPTTLTPCKAIDIIWSGFIIMSRSCRRS
jgi:hypothetical protein